MSVFSCICQTITYIIYLISPMGHAVTSVYSVRCSDGSTGLCLHLLLWAWVSIPPLSVGHVCTVIKTLHIVIAGDTCGALNTQIVMGFSYQCDACSNYHKDKWARQIGGGCSLRCKKRERGEERDSEKRYVVKKKKWLQRWEDNNTKKWYGRGNDGVGKVAFRKWWKDHFLSIHTLLWLIL